MRTSQFFWMAGLTLVLVFGRFLPNTKYFADADSYLPFHSILEFLATTIAAMIFALAWSLRARPDNARLMLAGVGFLAVCLIDMAHLFSYKGMPTFITENGAEKAIYFWLMARYVSAITLLAVALMPEQTWNRRTYLSLVLLALAVTVAVWWVGFWHLEAFPRTFVDGQGLTGFKIGAEYVLAAIYGTTACMLIRRMRREAASKVDESLWLAASVWTQGLAEMFFTLYTDLTDTYNFLGHVFKALAYLMAYRAIFVSGVLAPYRSLDIERGHLRTLLNTLPDLVWLKSEQGVYLSCNARFEKFFGAKEKEIVGKTDFDFVDPALASFFRENDLKAMHLGGPTLNEEKIAFADDGHEEMLETIKVPMRTESGVLVGVLGIARNITERKQAEEELRQHRLHLEELVAQRTLALEQSRDLAYSANRAKSIFLANMSHELRTPMNAIMGMTGLALRRAEDPKLRDQLGKIDTASKHLLNVINDILEISKIEAERLTLEHTPFRLGEPAENIMSLIQQKATEKNIKLHIEQASDLSHRSVIGDPTRLGQILFNLAGNAIKFTQTGTVTLRCQVAADNADRLQLRWEVADTGIGIPAEDQERIFTAFEQADGSMTRKYGGTGLGLAISKRLVSMMGGEIGVKSDPGKGSTFWFTMWLDKADAAVAQADAPSSARAAYQRLLEQHAGARILLVEDEPINQEVSLGLLEDVGLVVDLAADGEKAVALAREKRYNLILMDVQMPIMNGLDATNAIRADGRNTKTAILAMTANAFEEDRQACLAAGMNAHIAKPVKPESLYATLLIWLDQRGGGDCWFQMSG